jgi:DNA-binding transcriptional LysR family regulator
MDLNSLMIFARVVEVNSFSQAARRLKMPVSTVSRRIAELEDQLGVRLLERSTRSLRLTDVGSEVLEHARHSAELTEAVDGIVSNHLANVSGTLRLSAPPSISDSLLAPLLVAFQASYPNVRVQVFITERVVDQIAEGVDLSFRVGELEDSSLVARRLLTYRHQLVARPPILRSARRYSARGRITASRSDAVLQSVEEAISHNRQFVLQSDTKLALHFVCDSST